MRRALSDWPTVVSTDGLPSADAALEQETRRGRRHYGSFPTRICDLHHRSIRRLRLTRICSPQTEQSREVLCCTLRVRWRARCIPDCVVIRVLSRVVVGQQSAERIAEGALADRIPSVAEIQHPAVRGSAGRGERWPLADQAVPLRIEVAVCVRVHPVEVRIAEHDHADDLRIRWDCQVATLEDVAGDLRTLAV